MTADRSLSEWLARLYGAHVLGKEAPDQAQTEFVEALVADPALHKEATAMHAGFDDDVCKRSFVARQRRDAIKSALDAVGRRP